MTLVTTALSTSLDGFIAGPGDGPGQPLGVGGGALFEWFGNGDTPSKFYPSFRMSADSARFFDEGASRQGAIISGRRTYDITEGWGGDGPLPGIPLFVMTHSIPENVPAGEIPYTFVTDGIESAIEQARAVAAGQDVALMGADPVQQAIQAGLLDELTIHLVPVLLGQGVRLLDRLGPDLPKLACTGVVDAPGVTHLTYRVIR